VTPLPGAPPALRGAINLHGQVCPVAGLREVLMLPPAPAPEREVIVLVRRQALPVGLVVDAVGAIEEVPHAEVRVPGAEAHVAGAPYVAGRHPAGFTLLDARALSRHDVFVEE
jgi:purine-binding chemotaxis protein CheW